MKKPTAITALLLSAFCLATASHTTGAEVEYVYDNLNRVSYIIYNNQSVVSYTHDDVGNRKTEATDTDGDGVADNLDPFPLDPAH